MLVFYLAILNTVFSKSLSLLAGMTVALSNDCSISTKCSTLNPLYTEIAVHVYFISMLKEDSHESNIKPYSCMF